MEWKNYFKNRFKHIEFIEDRFDQEMKGDYRAIEYSEIWECDVDVLIEVKGEEKELNGNDIPIEVWSARDAHNIGWIYKQKETEYLIVINKLGGFLIDYEKLRKIWYKIYPNPTLKNDYEIRMKIANEYFELGWWYNKVQSSKNNSESVMIPIKWFKDNGLILDQWK